MAASYRHVAMVVPDLRAAEEYYRSVFDMELIGREAPQPDGLWYTLPFDKDWDDAAAAGVTLAMVALRKDQFVLALFQGEAAPGQVVFVGLSMPADDIAGVRSRLPQGAPEGPPDWLEFTDPYGITWQLSKPGNEFRTSGDWAGRWLTL